MVFDAVHLLASALQELDAERDEEVLPQQISCNGEVAWAHGTSLISYMKITKLQVGVAMVRHVLWEDCENGRLYCRLHCFRFHFTVQILVAIPSSKFEAVNHFHILS